MKKQLIGISSPNNNSARGAIAVIAEEFSLEHFSMRQPVINMLASLTNEHPTHHHFCNARNQIIQGLGSTVAETEAVLSFSLRTINPSFFIERMKVAQALSRRGMNNELFNGDIISGIKTEPEADWIRQQGGIVIHLYHYGDVAEFHALNEIDGDLVAIIGTESPTKNNMAATLAAIDVRITTAKKAA